MALYTHLSKQEISQLITPFGLAPPDRVKGVLEGTVNTYYQLFYPQKTYFLKIDETADRKRLRNELQVFHFLRRKRGKLNFKVPLPLPTRSGKYFIPFGKKFILLFEKVEGKTLLPNQLSINHLKQIGKALAVLHKAGNLAPLKEHRFHTQELKKVYLQIKKKLKSKHSKVDQLILHRFGWLKKNKPSSIPFGLIHADLFSENIIFKNQKLAGILDYEAAGSGPYLFDLSVALHALCHPQKRFSPQRIRALLQGYQSVRKITFYEKKYFEYYLYESALRFLLTRLRDFELKEGPVKAKPFKDYREFVRRLTEIPEVKLIF